MKHWEMLKYERYWTGRAVLTPLGRLMTRVRLGTADECWEWTGPLYNGYGRVKGKKRDEMVHRVAYELLVGPVPNGLQLDHLCRNRGCVNPAHLEPVTNRVNVLRGVSPIARQARQTHCKRGHRLEAPTAYVSRGRRICRTCHNLYRRAQWAARHAVQP